jgi:DNA-binding beta-propeller fold protein YncE
VRLVGVVLAIVVALVGVRSGIGAGQRTSEVRATESAAVVASGGGIRQAKGRAGCVADAGRDGCAKGIELRGISSVVVSPDGRHVYAAAEGSDLSGAVIAFSRSSGTGVLRQLSGKAGCVVQRRGRRCARAHGLLDAGEIAISPDGRNVYVATSVFDLPGGSLAVFRRDQRTGALTQPGGRRGCVNQGGRDRCAPGRALSGLSGVAVSPDGRFVYASAVDSHAVVVFARDARDGSLRQLAGASGCTRQDGRQGCARGRALISAASIAVSPDGRNVYVPSSDDSDAVANFARDANTGALSQLAGAAGCITQGPAGAECAVGRELGGAVRVAVSGDGASVYTAAFRSSALAVLTRDTSTGTLSQSPGLKGCVGYQAHGCQRARALGGAVAVAASPDGLNVYAAGKRSVAVFARNATTGDLSQLAGFTGCLTDDRTAGCTRARALNGAFDVAVSPDGRNVYVAASADNAIAFFTRDAP